MTPNTNETTIVTTPQHSQLEQQSWLPDTPALSAYDGGSGMTPTEIETKLEDSLNPLKSEVLHYEAGLFKKHQPVVSQE